MGINTPTASSGPSCSPRSAASPEPPSQATASHSPTAPTRRRGALAGPNVSSGPVPAGISPHTQVQTQRLSPGCPPSRVRATQPTKDGIFLELGASRTPEHIQGDKHEGQMQSLQGTQALPKVLHALVPAQQGRDTTPFGALEPFCLSHGARRWPSSRLTSPNLQPSCITWAML